MFNAKKDQATLSRALYGSGIKFDVSTLNNFFFIWVNHPTMKKLPAKRVAKLLASAKATEIKVYTNAAKAALGKSNNVPCYY